MSGSDSMENRDLAGLDLESRQMVLDTVAQLKKRLLSREKILDWDKHEIFPEDTIREMLGSDIGLQLLFIPEEYGGMGGGARDCCAVTREMAKVCLGIGTAFFAIQLGSDPIIVGATDKQKEKWLSAIASGNTIVAYGVTEPGAGSNVQAIQTKAEPITDAAGTITAYRINGTKQFISNGGYADIVTVLANTPEGPSFFIVEKDTPGFVPGKSEEKHGIRASNTSSLTFTDVVVPAENLIGGVPGQGLKHANKVFGYTRLMVASMAIGATEAAFEIAIPYAKERIQFGAPLSEKQGYTHKLIVPHLIKLEAATAYIDEISERLDGGEPDLAVEGAIAKYFATEAGNIAVEDAIQALGGYGYISEFMVEKIKRDVRITRIYEGTSEILQNIISTFRWKITRKSKGKFYGSLGAEMDRLEGISPDIGCRFYGMCAKALNETIQLVHEKKLTKTQYAMFALSDMMTHVEIGGAMARKASAALQRHAPEATKLVPMSRVFAAEVSQIVTQNILKIVIGTGQVSDQEALNFLTSVPYAQLAESYRNMIPNMDRIADIIFERA